MDAIDRADIYARAVFQIDARLRNDVGHRWRLASNVRCIRERTGDAYRRNGVWRFRRGSLSSEG
jgi:hypothetical protein